MSALDELNQGLADIRAAKIPELNMRIRALEVKLRDLEQRLAPLLEIIQPKGGR